MVMALAALHRPLTATLVIWLILWSPVRPVAHAQKQETPGRVVNYAPAVRIDWPNGRVEIDGKVVLREGMLELLACSPNTREHETIVATPARPLRIYEALALVGLTPGHPVKYDEESGRWLSPTGDSIRIEVRWNQDGQTRTADIGTWMRDVGTGRVVPPGVWTFAGSYQMEDNVFAADRNGTVVCVVDFGSALIALPELRSADNSALQLQANTKHIPEIGTAVTLLLSAVEPVRFELYIGPKGDIRYDDKPVSMKGLVERIGRFQRDHRFTTVVIKADPQAPSHLVKGIEEALRRSVKIGTVVRLIPEASRPKVDHPPLQDDSERP